MIHFSFSKTESTWRRDGGVSGARNGPDTTCALRGRNAKRNQCRKLYKGVGGSTSRMGFPWFSLLEST